VDFFIIYVSLTKSDISEICTKKMNDVPLFKVGKYTFQMEN
jgi:hypothetical protein